MTDNDLTASLTGSPADANPNPISHRFFLLAEFFSPWTSQPDDITLRDEEGLMAAANGPNASREEIEKWQNSRLYDIMHPESGNDLSEEDAKEKRHNELNHARCVSLVVLLLMIAGVVAFIKKLSTGNDVTRSPTPMPSLI